MKNEKILSGCSPLAIYITLFRGDWLLKFLYRTANVKLRVAGLGPVKWDNRRMHNIDLTDVVSSVIFFFTYLVP